MKKFICLMLALVMVLSLVACGEKSPAENNGPVVLKVGSQGAPDSLEVQTINSFAQLVNERSGGSLDIQVFPSSQLGSMTDMIEGVTLGTVDLCVVGMSNLTQICPEYAAYDMWFYDDATDVINVYNSEVGAKLRQTLVEKTGVRMLSYINCSAGQMYLWAKKPITTMADFNGLVLRVPGNKSIATALAALGTTANVPFGDMYTAAQTGVIDVGSADIATMISNGFDEVFPYCIEITGNYMPLSLIVSDAVYQGLTEEQQKIIEEAAVEACQYWDTHQEEVRKGDMDMLENSKAELVKMDSAELSKMDDLIHDAIEKYLSATIDADMIAEIRRITD